MKKLAILLAACVVVSLPAALPNDAPPAQKNSNVIAWPAGLPVYDHVVIVVEENKDHDQIFGKSEAPYLNALCQEGAQFTQMFGEEHNSQGNYFWLFSGSNQNVGFFDEVPKTPIHAANLGSALIHKGLTFKGYAESLDAIGSPIECIPPCEKDKKVTLIYGRKHVPWISFANVPNGKTVADSSNLTFKEFPAVPRRFFQAPDCRVRHPQPEQ